MPALINGAMCGWEPLIFSVMGAFMSFVVGGWVAGKIAGVRRAETAPSDGAIVWVVAVPMLLLLVALGAGSYFGSWYGGLAGASSWFTQLGEPASPPYQLPK